MNETTNLRDMLQLFHIVPVGFWTTFSVLYTHFLDKGVGNDRATNQAIEAITASLPVINGMIGQAGALRNVG